MATPQDFPLPPLVLRNLADRSFDKRRQGAVETEKVVRGLKAGGNQDAIKRVIQLLSQDYAGGVNSNNRKGGLVGLASCAIALGTDMNEFLDSVVPAVLKGFLDTESRVRYYACESLFNISRVCRGAMLAHFNDLFSGLCKIVADVDIDCRNGAILLDRLLKEIVLESPPAELSVHVATFVPILKAHMSGSANPYVRQTLIGWVVALDSVPDVDILPHAHELLSGLFNMLSDGNREVRSAAYTALGGLLDQLDKASGAERRWASSSRFLSLVEIVMNFSGRERDAFARLSSLEWMAHILARPLMRAELPPLFDKLAATLLRCMADAHGGPGAGPPGTVALSSGQEGREGRDAEVVDLCIRANNDLQELVRCTPASAFNALALVKTVTSDTFLCHSDRLARSCALRWTAQLLSPGQCPAAVLSCVEGQDGRTGVLDGLLKNLLDGIDSGSAGSASANGSTDSDVLKLTLEVMARLSIVDRDLLRARVLPELVRLFSMHRALLEGRAAFIVRRLCLLLEPRVVYLALSSILSTETNRDFASLLVELMNLLLLTALELSDFRDSLRGCCAPTASSSTSVTTTTPAPGTDGTAHSTQAPSAVFLALYRTWVMNPVAALSLCLLTQAYELADRIVLSLGESSVTLGLLMQVDKLVQLLESPVFLHTRLHLLQPDVAGGKAQAYLLRALYGLLMLLPQGAAYSTLKDRLAAVTNLHIATGGTFTGIRADTASSYGTNVGAGAVICVPVVDTEAMFSVFSRSQAAAKTALSTDLKARSLLSDIAVMGSDGQGVASSALAGAGAMPAPVSQATSGATQH